MRAVRQIITAGAVIAGMLMGGGAAAASPSATSCALTVGNVGYSAGMFYAGGRLSGDCYGQVTVDLQLSSTAAGPFSTVETAVTYPLNPDAQGGTAWFLEAYNTYGCGFYYRAVGTYADLTATSPLAQRPC
ncbi:hypothetical protein [Phytohabitans rumicis]|uniref:Spore-associated protein A n=1 Tax=Phytohabitans rumicis TaxID=1076125 RepID=A0A6V8KN62_9ACTN|nr:hypothetical protein [Phytohabitans rumicis]GFJ86612.1 hypothetical protein Prum_002540 [Phytohabitans rumicis]